MMAVSFEMFIPRMRTIPSAWKSKSYLYTGITVALTVNTHGRASPSFIDILYVTLSASKSPLSQLKVILTLTF